MRKVNRRTFVLGGLAATSAAVIPLHAIARAGAPSVQAVVSYPFKLGVASGEPDSGSAVLWTRLAPSPLDSDGHGGMPSSDIAVDWQVSRNERFSSGAIVASGTATARYADAHAVHVVAGGLDPDYDYFYRFRAQGHISAVGRTRTAPAPGSFGRDLELALCSCAHYESGYYTAYRRLAEDRPGLVLHLGDYIYEDARSSGSVREHLGSEIVSLADYRRRYAQYKADPDLQAAHAAAPWLVATDDHEVENNYANMVRNDNSPPLTAAQWAARRTAAYRAFWENMPLRPEQKYSGNSIPLFRRVHWGQLATFHMLDTRQFRDDQACGDGWDPPGCGAGSSRTLPGFDQESWLLDGLALQQGVWDFLGQQVFFARRLSSAGNVSMDAWDGYSASRARVQDGWVARGTRNPVVLTGDVHRHWAADLKADYANSNSATVGTELVCTSISSGGNGNGSASDGLLATNPHLKYVMNRRGYVRSTVTPTEVRADFRVVSSVTEHGAAAYTDRSFLILDGQPGLQNL